MGMRDVGPFVTVEEAALWLRVSVDQMLAWNMVAVMAMGEETVVPRWSIDPQIARYMPTLSEVFQGEALVYCLTHMRPFKDDRTGVDALRSGHWLRVLEMLREYRLRFDQVLAEDDDAMPGHFAGASAPLAQMRLH